MTAAPLTPVSARARTLIPMALTNSVTVHLLSVEGAQPDPLEPGLHRRRCRLAHEEGHEHAGVDVAHQ